VSVGRLASGKYQVRWRDENGKPKAKSFTRKRDADQWQDAVERAKQTGRVDLLDADLKTLAELAADHMEAVSGDLSDKTWTTYLNLWAAHVDARPLGKTDRTWHHAIADMTLRQIRPSEVEKWKADRIKDGAGLQSIRKTMALMQTILDRGVRDELIVSNPVKAIKKPSGKRAGAITVVTPEDVEKIRARMDDTGRMFVALLAGTGMRPGEVRALRWEHVQLKTIRVELGTNPDGTVKPTKTEQRRTVRLVAPLAADLKAYRKAQGNPKASALIFPKGEAAWTEDDYRNWTGRKFQTAAEAAGVTINRPYDLRHSAASLWLHEGINPVQVAAWLGHNVAELFKTYAHVLAEYDPAKRTTADKAIRDARRKVSRCTSDAHRVVQAGPSGSKAKATKPRGRAKTAA
jgi:integrase